MLPGPAVTDWIDSPARVGSERARPGAVWAWAAALIALALGAGPALGQGSTLPQHYVLAMVARTGGADRCEGVPEQSTISDADVAIDRSGSAAVRFLDTRTGRDGVYLYDAAMGSGRVMGLHDREELSHRAIAMRGGLIAVGRLDGGVEIYGKDGSVRGSIAPAGPLVEPQRLTLSARGQVAGTRLPPELGAAAHVLSQGGVFGEGSLRRVVASAQERGPFYSLGPCSIDGGGRVTGVARMAGGDAIVQWRTDGYSVVWSADAAGYLGLAPLSAASDSGRVAAAAIHESGWRMIRVDGGGATTVIASAEIGLPGGFLRGPSLSGRAPAVNDSGSVAFRASDDGGSAVYIGSGAGLPLRAAGYDDQVATRTGFIRLGQGDGPSRQVIISGVAINDSGQAAFIARLRDGTSGLIVATPATGACRLDFSGDGVLSPDDLADYISAYFAGEDSARTDINRDERTDPDDLADYLTGYFEGCDPA